MKNKEANFLKFQSVGLLTPFFQMCLITGLFVITTLWAYSQYQKEGAVFGYPLAATILFAPIYEEIIFRGWVLSGLFKEYGAKRAIIGTSILFGIWHLKNIFYLEKSELISQIFYTSFIFSPLLSYIALKYRTIWIGVILHYCNNLFSWAQITLGFSFFLEN